MPEDATKRERGDVLGLTAEIVSAYVGNNSIAQSVVADLIQTTFEKLNALAKGEDGTPIELTPAVPIKKSITNDYLCLSRRRQKAENAQPPSDVELWHDAARLSDKMGPQGRLSDGGAGLRSDAA